MHSHSFEGEKKKKNTNDDEGMKAHERNNKKCANCSVARVFGAVLEHSLLSVRPAQCKKSYDQNAMHALLKRILWLSRFFFISLHFYRLTSSFPFRIFLSHKKNIFFHSNYDQKSRLVIRSLICRRHHFGTSELFSQ